MEALIQANSDKSFIYIVNKLPYKFSFVFEDNQGKQSTLMIEDWETGALYWNMLKKTRSETESCKAVRQKYFDDFSKTKELHFYMGTSQAFHFVGHNPFMIIGTFSSEKNHTSNIRFIALNYLGTLSKHE